jgi:hypothetical protein
VHSTPYVCNLRRHRRRAVMSEEIERIVRIRRARNTPKSNMETRVALIVAERGLTEKHLAKYFVRRPQKLQPPMAKAQHEAPARRSSNSGLAFALRAEFAEREFRGTNGARRGTKGAWAQVRASSSRRLSLVVEVGIAAGGALKLKAISF